MSEGALLGRLVAFALLLQEAFASGDAPRALAGANVDALAVVAEALGPAAVPVVAFSRHQPLRSPRGRRGCHRSVAARTSGTVRRP